MADEEYGVTVGCKVPEWKRKALREAAFRQRTDVSKLLRPLIDELIEESDVDRSDVSDETEDDADK